MATNEIPELEDATATAKAVVTCRDGHEPVEAEKRDGKKVCPECGNEFKTDVSLEVGLGGF